MVFAIAGTCSIDTQKQSLHDVPWTVMSKTVNNPDRTNFDPSDNPTVAEWTQMRVQFWGGVQSFLVRTQVDQQSPVDKRVWYTSRHCHYSFCDECEFVRTGCYAAACLCCIVYPVSVAATWLRVYRKDSILLRSVATFTCLGVACCYGVSLYWYIYYCFRALPDSFSWQVGQLEGAWQVNGTLMTSNTPDTTVGRSGYDLASGWVLMCCASILQMVCTWIQLVVPAPLPTKGNKRPRKKIPKDKDVSPDDDDG